MPPLLLIVVLLLALPCSKAAAQSEGRAPAGAFPARTHALQPPGVVSDRLKWEGVGLYQRGETQALFQLVTHETHVSIPFDSLAISLDMATLVQWHPLGDDHVVALHSGNPELGAHFWEAPSPLFRYRLGVGATIPVATMTIVDGVEPPFAGSVVDLYPMLPLDNLLRLRTFGWNEHRLLPETVALVASGYVELTPHPALKLALEAALPVTIGFDGAARVRAQGALSASGRIDDLHDVGLRGELVTLTRGDEYLPQFTLELFARFVYPATQRPRPYVRVAMRVPFSSEYGPATSSSSVYASAGGSLEWGAMF